MFFLSGRCFHGNLTATIPIVSSFAIYRSGKKLSEFVPDPQPEAPGLGLYI